jgi:hypothetical protein
MQLQLVGIPAFWLLQLVEFVIFDHFRGPRDALAWILHWPSAEKRRV